MKITGAAPKIAVPTFIYMIIAIITDYLTKPIFMITRYDYSALVVIGSILIFLGALVVINAGRKLLRSFRANQLMTDGLYGIFRNPMYAGYLLFIIPGICLFFNSWLVLTAIIVNFILLQIFIRDEYRYLEDKFGEEYKAYLKKIWIKYL